MHCPLCLDTTLDVTFHAGIELDICPRCKGVWLDRGELERLAADATAHRSNAQVSDRSRPSDDPSPERRSDTKRDERNGKKKRKKRLADRLGDVFEEIIDL